MATNPQSGTCSLCDEVVAKRAMTRHLAKCLEAERAAGDCPSKGKAEKLFHLLVEGDGVSCCWMHLEVPARARFPDLDRFLRSTWLECCGHLSAFRFPKPKAPRKGDEFAHWLRYGAMDWLVDDRDSEHVLRTRLEDKITVGSKFADEYDFGSTTYLKLRVLGEALAPKGASRKDLVRLLARNLPPEYRCDCSAVGTRICVSCGACACEGCSATHRCDQGGGHLLPLVNSPRAGVCGYCG